MKCILNDQQLDSSCNSLSNSNRHHKGVWQFNRLSQIPVVRDQITSLLEKLDYGPRDQFAVQLSLEEALVNAFKHGNGMDPHKQVSVTSRINRQRAWIRIEDEGDGFVLRNVADPRLPQHRCRPSGRGLLLMRKFLDRVEYNEEGNVVRLCKVRSDLN